MRLVLRDYLALQKESGELDVLIPDLLLSMGLHPLNRAGTGNRQLGVDIPAVGVDPHDGVRKLVIVTAKQGDIDRATWNSGRLADVMPSLDEITGTYLRSHIEPAYQGLPVLVVVATGGDMDEQVRGEWASYTDNHSGILRRGGVGYDVSFDFWGGDRLAALIETYLVDEYLFPAPSPKDPGAPDVPDVMRRTLALAGDPNVDLGPYEAFVRSTLDPARLTDAGKRRRALRLLRLTVRVLFRWCEREQNLRPALLAAEYVFLRVWHVMAEQGLTARNRVERPELGLIYASWRDVLYAYLDVLRPHCEVPYGLFGYSPAESIEYPLRVFDLLGHLAIAGFDELSMGHTALAASQSVASVASDANDARLDATEADAHTTAPADPDVEAPPVAAAKDELQTEPASDPATNPEEPDEKAGETVLDLHTRARGHFGNARAIANRITALIVHNPASRTPPFDDAVVEVALVLVFLAAAGREKDASAWAGELARTAGFAQVHMPAHLPSYWGTYEDRVDRLLGADTPEFPSSMLLALLAEWAAVANNPALYADIRDAVTHPPRRVNLQTWVPTDETDAALYAGPAIDTGVMRTSVALPNELDVFAANVLREAAATDEAVPAYSADQHGLAVLSLVASRRFRTPTRPSFWRSLAPTT